MNRIMITIASVLAGGSLAACSPGDAEKAGESADSEYEETTQGQKDLTDGPLENAGEAIDRAGSDAREQARETGDAAQREADETKKDLEKATDGNPKT